LSGIKIAVLDDDVMDAGRGAAAGAAYDKFTHKMAIRRSSLIPDNSNNLQGQLKHEWGHAIFSATGELISTVGTWIELGAKTVEDSDVYFINNLFVETKRAAATKPEFSSVSLYSLDNARDFFTECVVAYINGEEDQSPYFDAVHGPKSRAELRQYLPEMYLALQLFLEPESRYFGDGEIFSQNSRETIRKMIDSPLGLELILSPKTHVAQVEQFYLMFKET
jgi:hypothetical protein